MKKVIVMFLALLMLLTGCTTVVEGVAQEDHDKLKADYAEIVKQHDELKAEYDELKTTVEKFDLLEWLPFKMFYYALLDGNDHDWESAMEDVAQEYGLSEADQLTLVENIQKLIGFEVPSTEDSSTDVPTVPTGKFNAEEVIGQLEVTEYSYSTDYQDYAFLVIKNNSKFNLSISAAVKFYNDKGELIGAETESESPIGSGCEFVLDFSPDEEFATMTYEFEVEEEDWYESAVHDLSYETVTAKEKEIVSVKNNGTEAVEFVEVSVLFFNGDDVVDFEWTYFADNDSEIKPGKTITEEIKCYEEYTSVRIFLTGYRDY